MILSFEPDPDGVCNICRNKKGRENEYNKGIVDENNRCKNILFWDENS